MENPPFEDVFPIQDGFFRNFDDFSTLRVQQCWLYENAHLFGEWWLESQGANQIRCICRLPFLFEECLLPN